MKLPCPAVEKPAAEITRNVRLLRENKRQKLLSNRDIRSRIADLYDPSLPNIRAGDSRSMDYVCNKEDIF